MIEWQKNKRPENLCVDLIILPAKDKNQIIQRCLRLKADAKDKIAIYESFLSGKSAVRTKINSKNVLFLRVDYPKSKKSYKSQIESILNYCEDEIIFSCAFPILMGHDISLRYAEIIVDRKLFTSKTCFYVCCPNNENIM